MRVSGLTWESCYFLEFSYPLTWNPTSSLNRVSVGFFPPPSTAWRYVPVHTLLRLHHDLCVVRFVNQLSYTDVSANVLLQPLPMVQTHPSTVQFEPTVVIEISHIQYQFLLVFLSQHVSSARSLLGYNGVRCAKIFHVLAVVPVSTTSAWRKFGLIFDEAWCRIDIWLCTRSGSQNVPVVFPLRPKTDSRPLLKTKNVRTTTRVQPAGCQVRRDTEANSMLTTAGVRRTTDFFEIRIV